MEDPEIVATPGKRDEPRIPFGWLVERGLLASRHRAGELDGRWTAKVRADGTLIAAEHRGSIHQVGALGAGRACLQRLAVLVLRVEGKLVPIDLLRQKLRAELH